MTEYEKLSIEIQMCQLTFVGMMFTIIAEDSSSVKENQIPGDIFNNALLALEELGEKVIDIL